MDKIKKFLSKSFFLIILLIVIILGISKSTVKAETINETFETQNYDIKSNSNNDNISELEIDNVGIDNFTNVKYIGNANYFKVNPKHAQNNGSDNAAGTCTTVAMQMLLGYHNYYTDRRLIPETGENGLRFLSEDYGEYLDNPNINPNVTEKNGRSSIGTEDGLYRELMDLNPISGVYGIGQLIYLVKDAADSFINKYASNVEDSVMLTAGIFDISEAKLDIDNGNPIILGRQSFLTGFKNFHVVVAYGYATYEGVDGFIVHCGWEHDNVHIWYPASWFGFQIRLSVDHEHDIIDTKENVNFFHRKITCASCGYSSAECFYKLDDSGTKIIDTPYELAGNITIPGIIYGNNITSIGSEAFKDCDEIEYISIPNTITTIESNAFENCTKIRSISIPKKVNDLGSDIFKGCSSLNRIYLNISKICTYMNNSNLLPYKDLLQTTGSIDNSNFNCRSEKRSSSKIIENSETLLYELNIDCPIQYGIEARSDKNIVMNIYSSDYSLLFSGTSIEFNSTEYMSYCYPLLEKGKYYVEIYFESSEDSGTIEYSIEPHTSTEEYITSNDTVNVLTHLHENKNEFVIYPSTSGLFLLELSGVVNGEQINPEGMFIIKNSSGEVVQKMNLSSYSHPAQSILGANNIMFYASSSTKYIVYIEVESLDYEDLILNIKRTEDLTIYGMDSDDKYVSNEDIESGDFACIYNLERVGTYNITFDYQGTQTSNMLFALFETNETGEYIYKEAYEINSNNNSITLTEVLTYSKNLLLCVFDSEGIGKLDINIAKYNSTTFTIITDPTTEMSGSEVKLNRGSLGGATITKGYTRICYLGQDAPDKRSRYTYYNWYSTNENVAKVSAYGTITAIGEGTAIIQCVYKADPSIKATIVIIVNEYTGTDCIYLEYGMDVRTGGTISGTEVTSGMGDEIEVSENPIVTMHPTKTRLICLGNDSPTTSIQDFEWTSNNSSIANVSSFGTITAYKTGSVIITGIYKYNPYYKVVISIEVIS